VAPPEPADLAVLGADPRFRGGMLAQLEAFWRGALELGRRPSFHYALHPSLAGVSVEGSPLDVPGVPSAFRWFDAGNQFLAGGWLAPELRDAQELWVVSTSASHGYAAVRSGRPYRAWLGTGLADEWAGRRPGLPASRRLALRVNAPTLRRLERRVLRGAERVYATSPWSRASVARAGDLSEESVGILPIPVDLDEFSPSDDWYSTLERPVLAFVGRADDTRKNVRLLLDALPSIPEVRVLLIGPAPASVPDRVEATGPVPSVAEHLRRATIFVLPSRQEGFGIAAAEALAAGLPVVTTPSGGPETLVGESGGGVVLAGFSPEELAAAVRELLADPARLEEMRRRGREYVAREHSPARFRELLADVLVGPS
jgi:glycosyltransferase involved in cell wall biosynthesis